MKFFRHIEVSVVRISHNNMPVRMRNVLDHVVDHRHDIIVILITSAIMSLKIPVVEKPSAVYKGIELQSSVLRFPTYVYSILVPA